MTDTNPNLIDRRTFLQRSALTCAAFSAPFWLGTREAQAAEGDPTLVVVFLRGGADGVNLVIPAGDSGYRTQRPTISLARKDRLRLRGTTEFDLHPAMTELKQLYDEKGSDLAFIHAAGWSDGLKTRSHFEAMDFMERAQHSPSGNGWLNGALGLLETRDALEAVAFGSRPLSLQGPSRSLALKNLASSQLRGARVGNRRAALDSMYVRNDVLGRATRAAFGAESTLGEIDTTPHPDAKYPGGGLAAGLKDAAALIKANLGVRVITLDTGGWDTHTDERNRINGLAGGLSGSLAAFWRDLEGPSGAKNRFRNKTLVLVMSEFGRTGKENGSGGTDHGFGSLMIALGGRVRGGRVISKLKNGNEGWPGLTSHENRDLLATTDFRDVFAEALQGHMGLSLGAQRPLFGDYTLRAGNRPGLF